MNLRRSRQAARRSAEATIMDGVRKFAEPLAPRTVQDWFVDGLETMDIWIDFDGDVEDALLRKLMEDLRSSLVSAFSELRPPYGCSLVVTREERAFGSVVVSKHRPDEASVLIHREVGL